MSNGETKVKHPGYDGMTFLADGMRVEKNSPYIEALGIVDELNSVVGMAIASDCGSDLSEVLCEAQEALVAMSHELAAPGSVFLTHNDLQRIEKELARWSAELPEPLGVPLPRGTMAAALLFKARATCRTLERCLVGLTDGDPDAAANSLRLPFADRLADLLQVLARTVNRRANAEVLARHSAAVAKSQA